MPGREVCDICSKTVYLNERLSANDRIYHKNCFRCKECKAQLSLGNFSSIKGQVYCKNCFRKVAIEGNAVNSLSRNSSNTTEPPIKDKQDGASMSSTISPSSSLDVADEDPSLLEFRKSQQAEVELLKKKQEEALRKYLSSKQVRQSTNITESNSTTNSNSSSSSSLLSSLENSSKSTQETVPSHQESIPSSQQSVLPLQETVPSSESSSSTASSNTVYESWNNLEQPSSPKANSQNTSQVASTSSSSSSTRPSNGASQSDDSFAYNLMPPVNSSAISIGAMNIEIPLMNNLAQMARERERSLQPSSSSSSSPSSSSSSSITTSSSSSHTIYVPMGSFASKSGPQSPAPVSSSSLPVYTAAFPLEDDTTPSDLTASMGAWTSGKLSKELSKSKEAVNQSGNPEMSREQEDAKRRQEEDDLRRRLEERIRIERERFEKEEEFRKLKEEELRRSLRQQQLIVSDDEEYSDLWFFPTLSRNDAEQTLARVKQNSFVVRLSSIPDRLVLSKFASGLMCHYLVEKFNNPGEGKRYRILDCDSDAGTYGSISDLVANSPFLSGCSPLGSINS